MRMIHIKQLRQHRLVPLLLLLLFVVVVVVVVNAIPTSTSSTSSSTNSKKTTKQDKDIIKVFRHDYLDYLDIETLQYYISSSGSSSSESNDNNNDSDTEYDVIIMFYVQWSQYCHTFASIYDQMSRIIKAGTKQSKLIMSLFDCEDTKQNENICQQIGITKYPTIAFISMNNKNTKSNTKNNTIYFYNGNWQYGDAILDWIYTLSKVSQWKRSSIRNSIYNTLSNIIPFYHYQQHHHSRNDNKQKSKSITTSTKNSSQQKVSSTSTVIIDEKDALPIGIPISTINTIQKELNTLQNEYNTTKSLLLKTNTLFNIFFTPILLQVEQQHDTTTNTTSSSISIYPIIHENHKNYTDMYGMLHQIHAWETISTTATSNHQNNIVQYNEILRTCVIELTIDYCDKLTNQYMQTFIDTYPINQKIITDDIYTTFQNSLYTYFNTTEPYCNRIDECVLSNFTNTTTTTTTTNNNTLLLPCQPYTCPFYDRTICRYLTACLSDQLYNEYNIALLNVSLSNHNNNNINAQQENNNRNNKNDKKKGFSWGL